MVYAVLTCTFLRGDPISEALDPPCSPDMLDLRFLLLLIWSASASICWFTFDPLRRLSSSFPFASLDSTLRYMLYISFRINRIFSSAAVTFSFLLANSFDKPWRRSLNSVMARLLSYLFCWSFSNSTSISFAWVANSARRLSLGAIHSFSSEDLFFKIMLTFSRSTFSF